MKKLIPIFVFIFLVLSCLASADSMVINASEMYHAITDHWTDDLYNHPHYMWDNNFATYDIPIGFYEASVYFNASINGSVDSAVWQVKTAGGVEQNITLPSQCLSNPLILKVTSHFVVGGKNFFFCYTNILDWQLVATLDPITAGLAEQRLFIEYSGVSPPPTCQLTCPTPKCIFYDHMTYTDSFQNCSYEMSPPLPGLVPSPFGDVFGIIYPYDSIDYFIHAIKPGTYYNDIYDTFSVFWGCAAGQCEPFYDAHGQIQHQLIYLDGPSSPPREFPAYDITFYYDVGLHQIFGFFFDSRIQTYSQFCSDCFEPYAGGHKIEIYSFNARQTEKSFFNVTSGLQQLFKPQSMTIFIDGVPVAYDLPLLNEVNNFETPKFISRTNFMIGQSVYLYNFDIYGADIIPPISNITTAKANFESCSKNEDCLSKFCLSGICSLKTFKASCQTNQECLSGLCSGGVCTSPSLWKQIDGAKTSLVGDDEVTNNFIALLISFAVFGAIFGGAIYLGMMGAGLVIGGAAFMALSVFFTIAGWLSPFILFGEFVLVAAVLFLAWLSGSGG